jgi:hypothetical protein
MPRISTNKANRIIAIAILLAIIIGIIYMANRPVPQTYDESDEVKNATGW